MFYYFIQWVKLKTNLCYKSGFSTSTKKLKLLKSLQNISEAKNKVKLHIHEVENEIFDIGRYSVLLQKAIQDSSHPLKVAQTRLMILSCVKTLLKWGLFSSSQKFFSSFISLFNSKIGGVL